MPFVKFILIAMLVVLAITGTISVGTAAIWALVVLFLGWIVTGVLMLGTFLVIGVAGVFCAVFG